jgi:dipeptidyl aminopeptidase/acylaminoacyl peptidase
MLDVKRTKIIITGAFLLAAIASIARAETAPPSLEAFGALPEETGLQSSPDGHWLAWIDHKEAKSRVVVIDLVSRKPQRILGAPEKTKIRALYWNDNETLLITLSETDESKVARELSSEYFRIIAHDVHGGNGRMLPMDPKAAANHLAQDPPLVQLIRGRTSKPHAVIAAARSDGCGKAYPKPYSSCLLEIDTVTGDWVVIKYGSTYTVGWVVDRDGHPVAREDWDWRKGAYRVYALEPDDHIREIMHTDDSAHPKLQGLLPDGSALVVLATNGGLHQAAWALPLDGSPMRLLENDPDADVERTSRDPNTGAIVGVYIGGEKPKFRWLESHAQHRADVLAKTFSGKRVELLNWTVDGTKVLVKVDTASNPPVYYWVDFATHQADIAGEEYPALANAALGEARQIGYKARDGTTIPAILTEPVGLSARPVPLVVLPHGGPNAHDAFEFDWLAQFFATRGYAVLQPQFRGSTGFGQAFEEAGYRQWGGLMQDDVTDGVKAMIEQGIADAHHVCIVGASYGGYAALAGAAFTPSLYSCAASINGVSDLPALMRSEVPVYVYASTIESFWKARIGTRNEARLGTVSPINSVKNINIPILIIYSRGDGVVPNEQSERMIQALRATGKTVEVDTLKGEDHWLSKTETRTQVLHTLDAFLKAHL